METLFSGAFAPFAAALVGLAVLAVLELIGLVLGMSLSDWVDHSVDWDHATVPAALNWFIVKEVPLTILFMLGLGGFGIGGFVLQGVLSQLQSAPAPLFLAVPLAFVSAVVFMRKGGQLVGPLFRTTTLAVSEQTLLGRIGTLMSPRAARGFMGEVKVLDEHGKTHYVMVEAAEDGIELLEGESIQLLSKTGAVYQGQRVQQRQ